ncbi:MAG: T9SS type A sorting domain-containing protein [Bacteroidota bacterium]|nr:T9SS type A sorting domain-containing protein [Bacteroidota bacterium]
MSRISFLLLYIILFCSQSFAQTLIPNSGFENWQDYDTLMQGHQLPSKWTAFKTDTLFNNGYQGMVRKSNYAARGNYSVQMIVDSTNNMYTEETLQNTFPFKGRPTSLRFFTSFSEEGNGASATVIFYALDTNGNWKTVGSGFNSFGYTQAGWVEQAFNILYTDTVLPTRCHIAFDYPSNAVGKKNISFYVDEISFSTNTNISDPISAIPNIFPCPAQKELFVDLKYSASIQIFDIMGKPIYKQAFLSGKSNLLIDNLPNGIHLLYIMYANGETTIDKIIIDHP